MLSKYIQRNMKYHCGEDEINLIMIGHKFIF